MIPLPYKLLAGMIVLLSLTVGSFFYGKHQQSRDDELVQQQEYQQAQQHFDAAMVAATKQREDAQKAALDQSNAASAAYHELEVQRDDALQKAVDASHTARGGLYLHTTCGAPKPAAAPSAGDSKVPSVTAIAAGDQQADLVKLPDGDADFLLRFAARCDAAATAYNRALEELMRDRQVCGVQ
jgi:hypothetical protein